MISYYSSEHTKHSPLHEFESGCLQPHPEAPERALALLKAAQRLGPVLPPEEFGLEPLNAVHSPDYLAYLEHAYAHWVAQGNATAGVIPSTFAVRWMDAPMPENAHFEPGYYAFDTSTPITAGTWPAARSAANVALSGAKRLLNGERGVYALCRPPGHHAGRDMLGGYCYLNNAAIAAQYLVTHSKKYVAILDIDLHHGNGTQQIFYGRAEVLFVSIHIDPAMYYPHFSGYAQEKGTGEELGYNLNIPLPPGAGDEAYLKALAQAFEKVRQVTPGFLVVSLGLDTYKDDPLSGFALSDDIYAQVGDKIAGLGLPTLFVQEGGYHLPTLGQHLEALLRGFDAHHF
jgi:acetoin utilization deacetylase AcuC-like enzyme